MNCSHEFWTKVQNLNFFQSLISGKNICIFKRTWCKESFALEIISLALALIAVRSSLIVFTGQAVHDIEVVGTELSRAITVFRKITSVDRLSAWCSRNADLKQKIITHTKKHFSLSYSDIKSNIMLTWQLSQHSPWEQTAPDVNLQVTASQHLLLHSCVK